jgi:hypothetical protein
LPVLQVPLGQQQPVQPEPQGQRELQELGLPVR